ncbi:MAG TPA: type I DNA topoisomerase [Candidatus Onthocola stercorigallinarum]|nr:type I DNA topoisomerase [Candidatus Onthocola stercorigallinarum]
MKNLVIVESPAKSKTIEKYLGGDYKVISSKGHIRDLATTGKFGLGVDVNDDFKPNYVIIKGKTKDVANIKKEVNSADMVYLATDPDREGETISWHIYDEVKIPDDKYKRVVFHEITKDVVIDAINNPGKIDMNLVKSGETRRILDRIIGFRLSKLMQSKTGGKSAGRVQSVALKLIVDREREIRAFVPKEYWTIEADFSSFKAILEKYRGKEIEIPNEEAADEILNNLSKSFKIESVTEKEKNKAAREVFKTSTLQQLASTKLGFAPAKTMKIAQKLYEGVDLGSETVGLITYMRTDSVRISDSFIAETYGYIKKTYGDDYVGYVKKGKRSENIQDAHEGIRPTSINRTPESVKPYLSSDEYKLYRLIYIRALASLMKDAKTLATTVILENNGYTFKATGSVLVFDGYLKVYHEYEDSEDVILPDFKNYKSDVIVADKIDKIQHFTKPAPRYTESSLIKEMESLGIGRPSTYATIVATIKDRGYVILKDKKFEPTEIGEETTDKLQEFFSDIVNVKYTAEMEHDLDEIAEDKMDNIKLLHEFYDKFEPLVEKAFKEMEKKAPVATGEICPECGGDLVIRKGKYGEFVACSNYPTCKYIKKEQKEVKEICKCPKCDKGTIVERKTKKGKIFYGCNNYPKCNYALWYKPTGDICPKCGELIVDKNGNNVCLNCDE